MPSIDPRIGQGPIEQLTGGTDERSPRLVLAVARLLTDQHQLCAGSSLTEDRLRRISVQVARLAPGGRASERLKAARRRGDRRWG